MTSMRNSLLALAGLALLAACAEVQGYGATAVERRRIMNDLQARATMTATCDISVGAYFRELSEAERRHVETICAGPASEAGAGEAVALPDSGF
jgi:hypothetical protein